MGVGETSVPMGAQVSRSGQAGGVGVQVCTRVRAGRQGRRGPRVPGQERTHQLDVVDCLLLELLQRPLGLWLQGEGKALQRLVLALHADLCLHLGAGKR